MAQTLRVIPPLPTTERGTSCSITCDKAGSLSSDENQILAVENQLEFWLILCARLAGELLLYCSGSNVIWRPVSAMAAGTEKPEEVFCWRGGLLCRTSVMLGAFRARRSGHVKNTTCAAMSPNGQWVASGDVTGAVRVWGAKGDHAQKNEYRLWDT